MSGMTGERSIEVKVGLLILVSLGILAAFVLVMGGLSFERTYPLYVDFDNPGALQPGAAVRIAGVKVGKVTELQFRGGAIDPKTDRRSLVRAVLAVEQRVKNTVHDDADFYVTAQGVLGEQFLAIEPGSLDRGVLPEGSIAKGIDPPRLDLFLARAYELLDGMVTGVRNNREFLSEIIVNTAGLMKTLNGTFTENRAKLDRIITNLDTLTSETTTLVHDVQTKYVDNPRIARTIDNVDRIASAVQKDTGPMLADAKVALANARRFSDLVGAPGEQEKMRGAIQNLVELAGRANNMAADAQTIVTHIKKGDGTIGALVMDEALYDDLQEMVRDLKHNPWKFLWRE